MTVQTRPQPSLSRFLAAEDGAITIDWVALTMGILLFGMAVVYAIFEEGVVHSVDDINRTLVEDYTPADLTDTPPRF